LITLRKDWIDCANFNWLNAFPRHVNRHLLRYTSDHSPIFLEFFDSNDCSTNVHKIKIKRFEQVWTIDIDSHHLVQNTWLTTSGDSVLKLQSTLNQLYDWGQTRFGDIPRKVKHLQEHLERLKNKVHNEESLINIKSIEKELDTVLKEEEMWWAQRAKINWLQHGDLNTKYFHYKASQRKRKSTIYNIKDNVGNLWEDSNHIHSIFTTYFKNIYSSAETIPNHDIFSVVQNRVNQAQYDYLDAKYTALDVSKTISDLKSNSAPGLGGLSALFFQKYWDIIGKDIIDYSLNILNNNGSPKDINHTYISLIPKISSPNFPSDFRPISLCNVILKIVTKTMANRIKSILPSIINAQQSAFLPGRLITDNTLIVFETFHYIKRPRKKVNGFVGIKLDIAKAYDSLEWNFIENTMRSMGFPPNTINVVMNCIRLVSFSIIINGQPTDTFTPYRDIKQGNPLSPYIFITCAEVLHGLISKSQEEGHIQFLLLLPMPPHISFTLC